MSERFLRTEMLLGAEGMERLYAARVAVFGIGGVGGYAAEALARSGIGQIDLIDNDVVCESNINRQIVAASGTIGSYKADVMKERIMEINPEAIVQVHHCFYLPETAEAFDFTQYTYIVDAVDTVTAKIELVVRAEKSGAPIISSMGAGNKLDPTQFEVTDIYQTSVCPLAKVMRKELKSRGIKQLKVVYSREAVRVPFFGEKEDAARRATPGSIAFVPSVAGLIIAGEVIKEIAGTNHKKG